MYKDFTQTIALLEIRPSQLAYTAAKYAHQTQSTGIHCS